MNQLLQAAEEMDVALDEAENRYESLKKHTDILHTVTDQDFDYQRRLMYHVLSYLDDIPVDLAIWAYDLIAAVDRQEFISQVAKNNELSEQEIRDAIKAKKDARREEQLAAIRKHLSSPTE